MDNDFTKEIAAQLKTIKMLLPLILIGVNRDATNKDEMMKKLEIFKLDSKDSISTSKIKDKDIESKMKKYIDDIYFNAISLIQ